MKFASPAFSRAVAGAAGFLILVALLGRLDVFPFAAILVAWCVVAYVRRPTWAQADGDGDDVTVRVSQQKVTEGEAFAVRMTSSDPHSFVTAGIGAVERSTMRPRWGNLTGEGSATISVTPLAWGRYQLTPVVARSSDALGAFSSSVRLSDVPFQVLPTPSRFTHPPALQEVLGVSGPHLSKTKGDGTAFADIRAFRPGDRLKRINWRVSSRTKELHVNEAFTERDTDILIVTDTQADLLPVGARENDSGSSLDMCVKALTGIAYHYVGIGDRVAVHDMGGRLKSLPYGTGMTQYKRVLECISLAHRGVITGFFAPPLPHVRRGTLVYVLTPLLSDDVITVIGRLRGQGAHVSIIDTLPAALGDPSRLTGKPLRIVEGRPDRRFYDEAWVFMTLQRRLRIRECERTGVHVLPWREEAAR